MPTTPSQFDIAIIGGGPAGASAAITAVRLGNRVGLFEARDFPRHKVCGEFLSAESLELLADLLQDLPSASVVFREAPVIGRTRLFFGSRMIEAPVSPPALSISRYDLDALLWDAALRAGVKAYSNCEVGCEGDGPFALAASCGNWTAKSVIIAAGRWSQFTRDRTPPPGPKWIGVKAHFREAGAALSTDLYFFDQGYCGVQPVAPDTVNACAMVRSDQAKTLEEVLELHPALGKRAAGWRPLMPPVTTAPLLHLPPQPAHGNMVFAGDAATFIDPFAGDGISIALRSGRIAAQCLSDFLARRVGLSDAVESYRREYMAQFSPLFAAAARIRSLFGLPAPAKPLVFELLRLPGALQYLIRKTRSN
jgi:flavin-dependent dehydrogenase